MPKQRCSVCRHPDVANIDTALKAGESVRKTAARFGLSPTAVGRHKLEDDRAKTSINTGQIAKIDDEIQKLKRAQNRAKKKRDAAGVLAIARELRNWFVLRQKAEIASIATTEASGKAEALSHDEALILARSLIEGSLGDPEIQTWLEALVLRVRATGNVPEVHK
jgi:hypothetical protein